MAPPLNERPDADAEAEAELRERAHPSADEYAWQLRGAIARGIGSRPDGVRPAPAQRTRHPALEWARSGAMALTGASQGPPRIAPGHLAVCCDGAARALRDLSLTPWPSDFDAPALLGERAAIAGLKRRGATAPGGSCRFVRCADAWIAVNLARPDDLELLPAWLAEGDWRDPAPSDVWGAVARAAQRCEAESLVGRGRLLGLPVAEATADHGARRSQQASDNDPPAWCRATRWSAPRQRSSGDRPLVVDLSSLWAGPLCTQLLSLAGARVIKVESGSRPDGARFGPAEFFDLMNGSKQSVAVNLASPADRQALQRLLAAADIVVESARPRALKQLGIEAEASVRQTPGQVWLSITGYGRRSPEAEWVAFGDDAAVAAGLALFDCSPASRTSAHSAGSALRANGDPLFVGDAIADPLTGLHAAVAALASWRAGGGVLLDVALRNVVAHAMAWRSPPRPASVRVAATTSHSENGSREPRWEVAADGDQQPVLAPRARPSRERARPLGADSNEVLREFAGRC